MFKLKERNLLLGFVLEVSSKCDCSDFDLKKYWALGVAWDGNDWEHFKPWQKFKPFHLGASQVLCTRTESDVLCLGLMGLDLTSLPFLLFDLLLPSVEEENVGTSIPTKLIWGKLVKIGREKPSRYYEGATFIKCLTRRQGKSIKRIIKK